MSAIGITRALLIRTRTAGITLFLAAAAVPVVVVACDYILHDKAFAFVDIGSDTFFCFYPLQLEVARLLQLFQFSGWSFHLGLGGYLGNLFDPSWLLTGWFPADWQLALRLPIFLLKTLLAGGFMLAYLREIGFEARLAVLGALCYAFCDYGMINAQWEVVSGTEFVQFSAFLFLLERNLRTGARWPAIVAGIVVGLGNPFGLYEFALFTVVYLLVRYGIAKRTPATEALHRTMTFGLWCVVGMMLIAPLLLPAVWHFLDNPRVSGAHSALSGLLHQVFSINDRTTISSEVGGLIGKNLFGIGNNYLGWMNYLEGPSFYVGLLPLLCMFQLVSGHATRREKTLFLIGTLGIVAYILFPALRYSAFAFGHVAFRFSTLWISSIVLVLGLLGLRRALISGISLPALAGGATVIIGISSAGLYFSPATTYAFHGFVVIAVTAIFAALLIIRRQWEWAWMHKHFVPILIVGTIAEIVLLSVPSVTHRVNVKLDGSSIAGSYSDGRSAIDYIQQREAATDFYRIMKTAPSVFLDDPLAQSYHGTTSYYFHDAAITRFVERMGIARPVPSINYIGSPRCCRSLLDLLAVKYVISRNGMRLPNLDLLTIKDGWRIYQNPSVLPFGFFVETLVEETDADSLGSASLHALMLKSAIVRSEATIQGRLDALDAAETAPRTLVHAEFHLEENSTIVGLASTDHARLLVFAMPFDQGWGALVDGEPADLIQVDYGLTALVVPAGHHRVQLDYLVSGRAVGMWLAVLGLFIVICGSALNRQSRSRE